MKASLDSPVVEQIKPVVGKATKKAKSKATDFLNNFSFDPHPMRTKIIFGAKVGIPALITGMILDRKRRSN